MELKQPWVTIDGQRVKPIVTSHSIDGTFASCPRRFEFSHVYQQVPEAGSTGMAAEVGTALHEALQEWARVWLMPGVNRYDRSVFDKAVAAGVWALLKWWPWILEEMAVEKKQLAGKQRGLTQALQLLMALMEHPFWDDYELATLPDGTPAIEIPWRVIHKSHGVAIDWSGTPRVLVTQGKIDFVLRHRQIGRLRVFDLKTTNKASDLLDAAFRFSGQGLGYSYIVGAALGTDLISTGIDVTYVVGSFLDFNIELKSYKLGGNEIEDYLETRSDNLDRMMAYLKRQWWPRKQHGCDSFGEACPYLDVCHRRDPKFISAWFEAEQTPFVERPRIYETYWTFMG